MKVKVLVSGAAAVSVFLFSVICLAQSAPQLVNYQGRLTDSSGMPLDGVTVTLNFTFYGAESGGTTYLSVQQNDVQVTGGLYNVLIGSGAVTPGAESTLADVFRNHRDVWMGVKVGADPEMSPRTRITSVPYALAFDLGFLYSSRDFDGDGHESVLFGGDDCNDSDPSTYRGAPEIPGDGIDQSCDGYPFGPLDVCQFLIGCGIEETDLDTCVAELEQDFAVSTMPLINFAGCMEGAACGDFPACFATAVSEFEDELCTYLDNCGYKNYSDCISDIDANWDGGLSLLTVPNACLQQDGSCDPQAIEQCLVMEEFYYNRGVTGAKVPWNQMGCGIYLDAEIMFADTADSYSIKSPKGSVFPLSYNEGWDWTRNLNYANLDEMMFSWPSGVYTLLKNGSTVETFIAPPYDDSNFPKGFMAVDPQNGSSIDQDPLPVSWQLAFPGPASPSYLEVQVQNMTRPGREESGDLPATLTSYDAPLPAGVQNGDSLMVMLISNGPDEQYRDPLDKWFLRSFRVMYGPEYKWVGP